MPTIYLLHFDPSYKHMQHYIGATERPVEVRFLEHLTGRGARIVQQARDAGCFIMIANTWQDKPWEFERQLKKRRAKEICPICLAKKKIGSPRASGVDFQNPYDY